MLEKAEVPPDLWSHKRIMFRSVFVFMRLCLLIHLIASLLFLFAFVDTLISATENHVFDLWSTSAFIVIGIFMMLYSY